MNPTEFLGSQIGEDPQNFIDEVKKIFEVMQVTGNDRVELKSYQLKDVAHVWLMTHAQQVEGDKLREQAKENKNVPSSKFRQDQKGRASSSKSQGSVLGTRTYPTFPKCCKNHPSEFLAGKDGCFGYGQSGHRLRDCPSKQGQEGNGRAQSTTSAVTAIRPTQQGNSSSTGGGQRQNRFYAL
ncbi:hypothetical protein R3W88_011831 [Solanum pinnatisectum]|uniref:Gag-pol polyprotein n=1 Tax=Solanum pinnatisectum TaxID=50273 RepID=A0AAV9L7Y3_9SOLN|nr:hypothetical protein R3W88_011831 [Solanum pinnatisectum]